ncbi:MAG: sulfotransferase [Chitinophagales bacterium]|nr:sulfotransferase [Chitinophagales bacterium]
MRLLMISAMYENGGNTTHRLLDGHPEFMVYPFESQTGTKYVLDFLTSLYPVKYRWPVFPIGVSTAEAYEMIIDEEAKVRSKTPYVSKFRTAVFEMDDKERKEIFIKKLEGIPLTRKALTQAFFFATFAAWRNHRKSGKETAYVGYSPIIGVDAEKIITDYGKDGFILHIIRNPFSAYADTKKRPVPLSLEHYITGWVTCQYLVGIYAEKYPKQCFILRYEDIIADKREALSDLFTSMGIKYSELIEYPSWNGEPLSEVYPWGTIRIPTEEVNIQTAKELSKQEIDEIYLRTKKYLEHFDYLSIYRKIT